MITEENKLRLLDQLQKAFPFKSIRGNTNDDGTANSMVISVKDINTDQLLTLSNIAKEINSSVKLKRSGTGISILFN